MATAAILGRDNSGRLIRDPALLVPLVGAGVLDLSGGVAAVDA